MRHTPRRTQQTGIGIIEIMVALVISLLLLTGVIQIYQNTKRSYNATENLSRTQESGRFAMHMLAESIRSTGFLPCLKPAKTANVVTGGGGISIDNIYNQPLTGFEGNASVFPADFPAVGAAPGERVGSSDGIIIIMGSGNIFSVLDHDEDAAQFELNSVQNLKDNDIVLACMNDQTVVFQISSVDDANKTIRHAMGVGTPGNCDIQLGGTGDCTNTVGLTKTSYSEDAQIMSIGSAAYYIGISSDGNTTSLYRSVAGAGAAEELLEGIESMQILYGVNSDNVILPAPVTDQYMTAAAVDAAAAWDKVVSIRIGLLAATPEEINIQNDTRNYNVAGTIIGTAGAVTHPQDRRSRYVFSSTIRLRNKTTGRML